MCLGEVAIFLGRLVLLLCNYKDWSTVCLGEIASIFIGFLGSILIAVQCVPVEISI